MKIKTAYNNTYSDGGVSFSTDSSVVAESFALRTNIRGIHPAFGLLQNGTCHSKTTVTKQK